MSKHLQPGEFYGATNSTRTSDLFVVTQLQHPGYRALPFHRHKANYITVLLSGDYYEQTANGRIDYLPFTSVFHAGNSGHQDVIGEAGASFLMIEALAPLGDLLEVDFASAPQAVELTRFRSVWQLVTRLGQGSGEALDSEVSLAATFSDVMRSARRTPRDLPSLRRAASFLRDNFDQSITLSSVARCCHVHPVYLGQAFREEFGQTLGQFLASLRVRAAAEAMLHTNRGLAEIAFSCGFCDQSHLTRTFRQYTRTTPSSFRATFGRRMFIAATKN